jgi:phosphatidylserine decarboxylase
METITFTILFSHLIILPVTWKWELDQNRVLIATLPIAMTLGIAVDIFSWSLPLTFTAKIGLGVVLTLFVSTAVLLFRFYRDEDRVPPSKPNVVVSPADGIIRYIRPIDEGAVTFSSKGKENVPLQSPLIDILPRKKGYLIAVAMSFLDVHVTRAPLEGVVSYVKHIDGDFFSLKRADAPYRNERVIEIIENEKYKVGIIQIASRLVRRIVTYANLGERVSLAQRIGMIKLGSQVDIILPEIEGLTIDVRVGQKVLAGESIIATYNKDGVDG